MAWLLFKRGTTADYKGERVKILEVAFGTALINVPSIKKIISVPIDYLSNFNPQPKKIN